MLIGYSPQAENAPFITLLQMAFPPVISVCFVLSNQEFYKVSGLTLKVSSSLIDRFIFLSLNFE